MKALQLGLIHQNRFAISRQFSVGQSFHATSSPRVTDVSACCPQVEIIKPAVCGKLGDDRAAVPMDDVRQRRSTAPEFVDESDFLSLGIQPCRLRGARDYCFFKSAQARNVSQLATCPVFKPVMNQRVRCAEVPWVKASGTT
jgi:hypothetical protein